MRMTSASSWKKPTTTSSYPDRFSADRSVAEGRHQTGFGGNPIIQRQQTMTQILSQRVVIPNAQGLHARPANVFARQASRFESRIDVIRGAERVDGKSILSILTLGAEQGTELSIEAHGPDAQEAIASLVELVERGFEDMSES